MRVKKLWLACVLGLVAMAFLLYPKNLVRSESAEPRFDVVLNEYAPAEWNQGYGHYDLTIVSDADFDCRIGGKWVECRLVTLSYGPIEGDESPARVHFYTDIRTDHAPDRQLVVYEGLSLKDFNAFMRWFEGSFARYDSMGWDFHIFRVKEKDFAIYSVAWKKNCASGALRLMDELPGIDDPGRNKSAGAIEKLEEYFGKKDYI